MSTGQLLGRLIGHICGIVGVLLGGWALLRYFYLAPNPSDAETTVLFFVYGIALEGWGSLLVWFAGGKAA